MDTFRWPFSRAFTLVWLGQSVSVLGSAVTRFGLSVWVYQQTGSATQFALVLTAATVPQVLLLPVAGVLADRWGRRRMMMLGDAGAGLAAAGLWLLLVVGALEIWHFYVAIGLHATSGALQLPAYTAAIPTIVGKKRLSRANGLVEISAATGKVLGPFFGGALLAIAGLEIILAVDVATFLFAFATLVVAYIPRPSAGRQVLTIRQTLRETVRGWTYIQQRKGLLALTVFFVLTNFTSAVPCVLLPPLVLSFTSEVELGTIMSALGFGMVGGGLLLSTWREPRNLLLGIVGATFLQGVAFTCYGVSRQVLLIGAAAFLSGACMSLIRGTNQTLWQRKVAPAMLGRVSSFRSAVTGLSYPLAFVASGVAADQLFEPLLEAGGLLAPSVGAVIGVGPGRGTALLVVCAGLLTTLICAGMYAYPALRHLEEDLPDKV